VGRFTRKTCESCGEECLEGEPRCWACGGWLAADPLATVAAPHLDPRETTLPPGSGSPAASAAAASPEPTLAWDAPPSGFRLTPAARWWGAAAAAAAALVLAASTGFWIGRSTAPASVPPADEPPPEPRAGRPGPEILPRPPAPGNATVQVRPLGPVPGGPAQPGAAAPAAPARPPAGGAAGFERGPRVPAAPPALPRRNPAPPPVAASPPVAAPPPGAPPAAAPLLQPDARTAILALRNETPLLVELRLEGFNGADDGSLTLAPGAAFDWRVQAGDYRLLVSGHGAAGAVAKAAFAGQERYGLVVASGDDGALGVTVHPARAEGR
jgi:hypothetical protein